MRMTHIDWERPTNARNLRDIGRIEHIQTVVADCLCAIARTDPLEHPDAKFHPDDLRDPLRAVMQSLTAELRRITEAALEVPDPEDITAKIRDYRDE